MDPGETTFYSNRARCYKHMNYFDDAIKDLDKALNINDKNIKALLLYGQCLLEKSKNDKDLIKVKLGIEKMQKAKNLCPSQGGESAK